MAASISSYDIGVTMGTGRTQDIFQTIVRGRKSWKTLRGNGEAVWPPELEAALLEGLERYQPDDSRETRLLGRFPMRNRFISDYIFRVTGKRRTAKQVGSRLQQLRDTCGGKQSVMSLLSPCPRETASAHDMGPSFDTSSMTDHPLPRTIVCIDIIPSDTNASSSSSTSTSLMAMGYPNGQSDIVRPSPYPRDLRTIDPRVTLRSPCSIEARSFFNVFLDDSSVHTEECPLIPLDLQSSSEATFLYSTTLVPNYWEDIASSQDPTRFTIIQEVYTSSSVLFSAMYKFEYPTALGFSSYASQVHSSHNDNHIDHTYETALNCHPADHNSFLTVSSERDTNSCNLPDGYNFEGAWVPPQHLNVSMGNNSDYGNYGGGWRPHEGDDDDSSLSSLSPSSTCFPTSYVI